MRSDRSLTASPQVLRTLPASETSGYEVAAVMYTDILLLLNFITFM